MVQSGKTKKKSVSDDGSIMATSTTGLTTEIGLSEMDKMIGQGPNTSHFKVPFFGGSSGGVNCLYMRN